MESTRHQLDLDHELLRECLRRRMRRLRETLGEALLGNIPLYQNYLDKEVYGARYPTAELRSEYLEALRKQETQLNSAIHEIHAYGLPYLDSVNANEH